MNVLKSINMRLGFWCLIISLSIMIGVVAIYQFESSPLNHIVHSVNRWKPVEHQPKMIFALYGQEMKRTLIDVAKHLAKAHRYARSGKTILELKEAYEKLTDLLDTMHAYDANSEIETALTLNTNVYFNLSSSISDSILDVCPEVFTNRTYGYPFFFNGFEMLHCDRYHVRPFSQILSLFFDFIDDIEMSSATQIFRDLNSTEYRMLPLIIVVNSEVDEQFIEHEIKSYNFNASIFRSNNSVEALSTVHTDYILVLRDLIHFDFNSRLERLVRLISYKVADLVAGSQRTANGHWMSGCHQIAMKNYTLRLVEGYDLSYNACMYCDYSSGPFVMRTNLLQSFLSKDLKNQNRYLDLMLTLRSKNYVMMTCPDAMFYTHRLGVQNLTSKSDWYPLIQKWKLNRIIFPDNSDLFFTCGQAKIGCYKDRGYVLSICCLNELNHMLNLAHDLFVANNISYEMDAGSLLSVAKLENALPWERDHDLTLLSSDIDKVMKLNDKVKPFGYKFVFESKPIETCFKPIHECIKTTSINCGYVAYRGPNWRIELWGANCLSTHVIEPLNGTNSTCVRNAGHWVNVPTNPASAARNKYAYQVLRHAEHWITLGEKTGRIYYKAGEFSKCPTPGFHGCLENYLPDGNLQFRDIWI